MKTTYLILSTLLFVIIASCSSDSTEKEEQNDGVKSKETASKLGQKTKAPIINITKFSKMSKEDLRLARNTVFAKYGRVFKSKDLKDHFAKQDWYNANPGFRESNMKQQDVDIVNLIQRWEEKTDIVLQERADITGNGSYEDCFVLYNKNKGTYAVIVNDFSKEFDHFWGQNKENQGAPEDWTKIEARIIDIDVEDFKQEILISQRYDDWEDPGTQNIVIAFDDGVQITELSSTDYDAGRLEIDGDGEVMMNYSNCPEHSKFFMLNKGKLVQTDEKVSPPPPGGCAACFSGESQVSISLHETKRIEELQRGDLILTFDSSSNTYHQTEVERVLRVYHSSLYNVNIGESTITVTEDHPFLTKDGWCSLEPAKTMERYGYTDVKLLKEGTELIHQDETAISVESIEKGSEGMMTYTISTLENGNNFIVNGVVVGTESIIDHF